MNAGMDITAWSAVSPYGIGEEAFREGLRERRGTAAVLDPQVWRVPEPRACLVPDFDPRALLGKKGTRTMNRVTGLAVTAVGALLDSAGEYQAREHGAVGAEIALVLGTTTGSLQSMMDFTRASLTGDRPFDVDPGLIPNSVMNCAAAQCAIWHRILGPNTTLACGRPSALFGLLYARRLMLAGRARTVLCGAAEEYSTARSWLEYHQRDGAPALLGEGGTVVRLEPEGARDALATVSAVRSGMHIAGTDLADVVERVAREALGWAGMRPEQVWAAVPSGLCEDESRAVAGLVGVEALERIPPMAELLGDTGAASAGFQIAAVLAMADEAPGRSVLITSVDPQGTVAAAVLRLARER